MDEEILPEEENKRIKNLRSIGIADQTRNVSEWIDRQIENKKGKTSMKAKRYNPFTKQELKNPFTDNENAGFRSEPKGIENSPFKPSGQSMIHRIGSEENNQGIFNMPRKKKGIW